MQIKKNSLTFNVEPCSVVKPNDEWFGGSKIFWDLLVSGQWETDTFSVFDKYASKDSSYIDIGSWVGPTVLYGAQLFKKCYAFEPDSVARELLKSNLAVNPDISNIELFSEAIADYTGQIQFGTNTNMGDSMSSILWNKESSLINCISLEDFILNNNIKDCSFIKVDIEGGEMQILPSFKNISNQIDATLCVSLHTPFFSNKKLFLETILESLSLYKNIYSSYGQKLSSNDILNFSSFETIVATNR